LDFPRGGRPPGLALDLNLVGTEESSESSSLVWEAQDAEDARLREREDVDFSSMSESDGAMKSSSSSATDDFRPAKQSALETMRQHSGIRQRTKHRGRCYMPFFVGDFLNRVSFCVNDIATSSSSPSSSPERERGPEVRAFLVLPGQH
jgi:hypothetical protein